MPAQRAAQVALDVVVERLERRDVEQAQALAPAAARRSRSIPQRKAASVLPEPVGAWMSTLEPLAIAGQPSVLGGGRSWRTCARTRLVSARRRSREHPSQIRVASAACRCERLYVGPGSTPAPSPRVPAPAARVRLLIAFSRRRARLEAPARAESGQNSSQTQADDDDSRSDDNRPRHLSRADDGEPPRKLGPAHRPARRALAVAATRKARGRARLCRRVAALGHNLPGRRDRRLSRRGRSGRGSPTQGQHPPPVHAPEGGGGASLPLYPGACPQALARVAGCAVSSRHPRPPSSWRQLSRPIRGLAPFTSSETGAMWSARYSRRAG